MQDPLNIWQYRVPFYVDLTSRYVVGRPGQDHVAVPTHQLDLAENAGQYQGHVIFHPEYGEIVAWPECSVPDDVKDRILSMTRFVWRRSAR